MGRRGFAAIFALAAPFATDGPTDIFVAPIERSGCRHHEAARTERIGDQLATAAAGAPTG